MNTEAGVAAAMKPLDYPFAAPAHDGSAVEVAPGVLWVRMPMPIALDHINVWLLRGDPFMPQRLPHYQRLRGGDVLDIGSRRWQVLIGEGHSPEHACLHCAEDGLLIAGDQLLPRISSNVLVNAFEPEANPLAHWFDSLDMLDHCRPDTLVLPSHQDAFRGLHARVQSLHQHHQRQFDALRAFVGQRPDCSAFDAMGALFPRQRHPADEMLAMGETVAHLAWLRLAGSLTRRLDDEGIHRWRLSELPLTAEVHL